MATIPTIQLLRNNNIYSSRDAARSALELHKKDVPDGGVILARYSGTTGEEKIIKTLAGFVSNISTSENATVTIIDVEGAAKNVQSAIEKAINDLNKADNAVDGQYVSSVSEDKGIITVTRKPLPSFDEKTDSGKAITAITQTNGEVSVKFGGVAAANVSVADEDNIFTATTVEGVLSEIKNYIGTGGSVETQIANAINGISGTTEITDGKIITTISQTDGKVSVTAATLGADKVSASPIDSGNTTVAVTGTNVSAQIGSLAKSIKSVASDAKSYSISSMAKEETTALGANVLEAYKLVDEDGAQAGATIKIYKDSSLKSVALNGQMLNFTYILADGNESTVGVDVSTFLAESEFKDGLEVVDGIVKVKKDASSEKFLSVSESGVKLDGVQAAINTAAASAKTKVEKASDATHITVTPTTSDVDGSVTYTIGESDIASATDLAKEIQDRQNAISGISGTTEITDGKVITAISQTAGIVSVTAATLGADNVTASTIASGNTTVAVTGETVSAQIASLATSIKSVSTAAAAAHTVVNAKADGHVTVEVSNDGSHDVVTIAENNIASANDLSAEVSARQSADTTLQNNIDNVNSTLSNYYTKTEVDDELLNYYTKTDIDNNYWTKNQTDYKIATEIQGLHAEVESTIESTPETTTTKAIKIVQDMGKITSITLGAFDCGTY